jgi:hypothetical protein
VLYAGRLDWRRTSPRSEQGCFSTLSPITKVIAAKILLDNGPSSNIEFTQEELAGGSWFEKAGQKPLGGHQFMFDPSPGFFVLRRRKAALLEIFLFAFFAPSAFVPRSQNCGGQDGATGFRAYTTIAKPNPNPARTFVSFVNFCKKSLSSCPSAFVPYSQNYGGQDGATSFWSSVNFRLRRLYLCAFAWDFIRVLS